MSKTLSSYPPALTRALAGETSRASSRQIAVDELSSAWTKFIPVPCRLVAASGAIVWQTCALEQLLRLEPGQPCCASLGIQHYDDDCLSLQTILTGRPHSQSRWLGRSFVAIETIPVTDSEGRVIASFERFGDVTVERRLEVALMRQQDLLMTMHYALMDVNRTLDAARNASLQNRPEVPPDSPTSSQSEEQPASSIEASDSQVTCKCLEEWLGLCRGSTERLHRTVLDLLDIAGIESGRVAFDFTPFCIADLLNASFQSVRPMADQKSLTIQTNGPTNVEMVADRARLAQVLNKLLINAIASTDNGGVTVDVDPLPNKVIFHVRDTGVGIAPEDIDHVFDKHQATRNGIQPDGAGAGLGLSLARSIVHEHGGEILVSSRFGDGSCFTLTIPQPPGRVAHGGANTDAAR